MNFNNHTVNPEKHATRSFNFTNRALSWQELLIFNAFIVLLILLTASTVTIAQTNHSVTFGVYEEKSPVSYATVVIRNFKDTLQQVLITNENGFCIARNISKDTRYQILIRQLGYEPYADTLVIGDKTTLDIHLKLLPGQLHEVTIKGAQGYVTRVGPKLLVNVQDLKKFTTETSILGIMNYAPGVIVDNGRISLNGRPGTKVLIDGRDQLNFSTQQLKTILAENVKTIEIIENPTAQYDASGTGGVINIITKKNFGEQFTDTFSPNFTSGKTNSAGLNNDIVFSTDRLLLNSSLSYINNGAIADKRFIQTSRDTQNPFKIEDLGNSNERSRYSSGSIGMDYKLTKQQVLSAGASLFHTNSDNYINSVQTYSGQNIGLAGNAIFNGYNGKNGTNAYAYLGLNTTLDTLQSTRKIFIDFTSYKSNQSVDNSANGPSQQQLTQGTVLNHTKLISGNLDYNRILNKKTTLDYGLHYAASFLKSDSKYGFSNHGVNTNESQGTDYTEQQGAVYADLNRNYERISISLGLRAEYLYFDNQFFQSNTTGGKFDKSYFNIFPTFNINYVATEKATFSFFGGRRIVRPPYTYFSPYINVINNFSYFTGNPALVPSFVYNVGSSLLLNHKYSLSFSYAYTDKAIGSIQYYNPETSTTIYTIGNLSNQHNLNLSAFIPVQLTEKISLRMSSAAFFNKYKNTLQTPQYKPKGSLGYYFRINAAYEVTPLLTVNSTYYYLSAYQQLQLQRSERSYLDLGFNYTVKPDQLTIKLTFNDLLWKYNSSEHSISSASALDTYDRYDTRKIELGLTYRFGGMKSKKRTTESKNEDRYRLN